jgi:hypothetical protein
MIGCLVYLLYEGKLLITLDAEQVELGTVSLKTRPLPCSHWPLSCSCPPEPCSCFVLGCGGALRAPLAYGQVVGVLDGEVVRSTARGAVVFRAVRAVPIREATAVIDRHSVQAWEHLEERMAETMLWNVGGEDPAASDEWRQRSEYFERICRDLTRLARERDRIARDATNHLLAVRQAAHRWRRDLACALQGRLLFADSSLLNESGEAALEDSSVLDGEAGAITNPSKAPFYTGQALIVWDELHPAEAPDDVSDARCSWRWLTHDRFGRFRVVISTPASLQSLPWMYIPIAEDVGNALRAEQSSTTDTSSAPANARRYVHTKPIRLAPDVAREVRFRLEAIQQVCRCRSAVVAEQNTAPCDDEANNIEKWRRSGSCCISCSVWALSWPGVLEMTSDILKQWPTWQIQQDRAHETAFTLVVDGVTHAYRAWSRHERDVIVTCLRDWRTLASADARQSGALIVAGGTSVPASDHP